MATLADQTAAAMEATRAADPAIESSARREWRASERVKGTAATEGAAGEQLGNQEHA